MRDIQLSETTPPYSITPLILDLVARIGEAIGSVDEAGTLANPRLRRANRIRAIQGSLAIEGNRLSLEQISAILDGKLVIAPLREVQEVRTAIKAYEEYPRWDPASEDDLLAAHGVLMAALLDVPGNYRRGGVAVVGGGEVHHIGPSANRVPLLMSNLLTWLAESKEHPLIASSIFHYEFEFIHPFADGNGRMGRLWQTLILTRWNPLFTHIPVESHIYARQSDYYKAIQQSTTEGTSAPFIVYMLEAILDAVVSTLQESHQELPSVAASGRLDSQQDRLSSPSRQDRTE